MPRRALLVGIVGALLPILGCGGSAGSRSVRTPARSSPSTTAPTATSRALQVTGPCGSRTTPPRRYRHVVWIWMENKPANAVIDSPDAPFQTSLARECATATAVAVVGAPSLPNYLGATGGSTFGVHDNEPPAAHPISADNLFRQVRAAGGTAKSYQEDMPGTCALESAGPYAVKHNPAAYYSAPKDRAACERDNVGLDAFDPGALPTFAFVTPNLCHGTHDCPVSTGDQWLAGFVGPLLASRAYARGDTAVIVWYDEYTPLPNAWIAPSVQPGSRFTTPTDQYALLRTTEDLLGITDHLGGAADAPTLRGAFNL